MKKLAGLFFDNSRIRMCDTGGRLQRTVHFIELLFEPRDLWVGLYIAGDAFYLCLVPTIVLKIHRGPWKAVRR